MSVRIYAYKNCSTCQKALKFLTAKGIAYEYLPIVEQPPTVPELKRMLEYLKKKDGTFKNLFNTSGQLYRSMEVSEKIKSGMNEDEALNLLAKNGKLIKRPFVLLADNGIVGFKIETWRKIFNAGRI